MAYGRTARRWRRLRQCCRRSSPTSRGLLAWLMGSLSAIVVCSCHRPFYPACSFGFPRSSMRSFGAADMTEELPKAVRS